MKKVIPFLLAAVLISACGTANSEESADKSGKTKAVSEEHIESTVKNSDSKEAVSSLTTETKNEPAKTTDEPKEENKMLTKRDVDLHGQLPWKWAASKTIKQWMDNGKTVYLWSDADDIEKLVIETMDYHPPENAPEGATREAAFKSANDYIQLFVQDMQKQGLNKPNYLDQISKVGEFMAAGKLDEAKAALDKATQIRTGQ